MQPKPMHTVFVLVLVGVLSAACGGSGSAAPSEANRVATRVAEEVAVAATLTALAPSSEPPAVKTAPPAVAAETTPPVQAPTETASTDTAPSVPSTAEAAVPPDATQPPPSTAEPTAAPPVASCRVLAAGLNLRPGPGTVYAPPLAGLARDAELRPVSFVARGFPTGQWIEVQVVANGRTGWVSAGQQFVACNVQLASLPAGSPPPTPTPAPTAILTAPPATATPAAQVAVIPVDGSDGNKALGNNRGVNAGRNLLLPGFAPYEVSNPMVFGDRIVFRAEVFDRGVGQTDGAGIDNVSFIIRDETGAVVHERTERNAGYCAFGGGEPDCTVWRFSEHGDKWPGGADLHTGSHDAQIVINPKNGEAVTWFWNFRIEK